MPVTSTAIRRLRADSLQKAIPIDAGLLSLVAGHPSHAFLANPPAHNVYLYLCNYVRSFSEAWFGRPSSDVRALDWGCGKGHVSYLLRKQGIEVISCDVQSSADDSAFGQETPIIRGAGIDVVPLRHPYELPFSSGSFNVVLSVGVLEHVPNDQASLREIARVLRPDGLFFCFFLPYVGSWIQRLSRAGGDTYHDRLYTRRGIRRLVGQSGMELLDLWHRALLPKNRGRYPCYHLVERLDQMLTFHTPLRLLATNIEFIAVRRDAGFRYAADEASTDDRAAAP